ncbi:GDSL-type esterase/lipase family protein [uncultured Sunxiuqinia sp.]|uniref:GDSL-type esterase/lipase family protein n=1 Tax=uncultured Sunxiuqinia sp. TaxID=1573825 RepID=UPI002AA6FB97|nr:GDSL-type esterase/lipase family protein [uncultured Sunxiuqinia sp.]
MKKNIKKFSLLFVAVLIFATNIAFAQYDPEVKWGPSIANYEHKDSIAMPEPGGILLLGSSSFTIWQDVQDYFPDKNIVNRGFGGAQMSDILHFKERLILPYKPSQIVVFVGGNDLAAGDDPKTIFREGKELVKWTRKQFPDVQFSFLSMKPSPKRWELKNDMLELNNMLIKRARKKYIDYIDIWNPMLVNGEPVKENYLDDLLHLNSMGYKIWQNAMNPYLK